MGKKSLLSSQPPPFYASISCHISVHYYARNKLKFSIHYYVWKRLAKGQSSKRIIRLCFFAFCVSFAVNLVTTRSTFQPAQHGGFVEPGAGAAQPRESCFRPNLLAVSLPSPAFITYRPVEETKKMTSYKRLMYKQFVLCRALYGDAILVHQRCNDMAAGNQQKHLEFTFSMIALSFHSRTSIRTHKHIF